MIIPNGCPSCPNTLLQESKGFRTLVRQPRTSPVKLLGAGLDSRGAKPRISWRLTKERLSKPPRNMGKMRNLHLGTTNQQYTQSNWNEEPWRIGWFPSVCSRI